MIRPAAELDPVCLMNCVKCSTHLKSCAEVCVCALQLALCSKHHSFSPTVAEEKTPYKLNNKEM